MTVATVWCHTRFPHSEQNFGIVVNLNPHSPQNFGLLVPVGDELGGDDDVTTGLVDTAGGGG